MPYYPFILFIVTCNVVEHPRKKVVHVIAYVIKPIHIKSLFFLSQKVHFSSLCNTETEKCKAALREDFPVSEHFV